MITTISGARIAYDNEVAGDAVEVEEIAAELENCDELVADEVTVGEVDTTVTPVAVADADELKELELVEREEEPVVELLDSVVTAAAGAARYKLSSQ